MSTQLQPETEAAGVSWADTIMKGKPFRRLFTFQQETGAPTELSNFQIDVTPDNGEPFSWTPANGKIVWQGAGKYLLDLTAEDTAALTWANASYCFNGTEPSGDPSPCFLSGLLSTEG